MIELICICSLAFYGSAVARSEDMIFEQIGLDLDIWFGYYNKINDLDSGIKGKGTFLKWLRKPLYGCPKCMPSIWGTIAFVLKHLNDPRPLYYLIPLWIASVFAMTGLVYVLMFQFPIDDE